MKSKSTQEKDSKKEPIARMYAEERGILEYKVKGNRMIYYANYPATQSLPRRTYKITVRLDTLKEERQLLTKWNPKGNFNMCR